MSPLPILEAYPRPSHYVDVRRTAARVHHITADNPRGYPVRPRPWAQVHGIVLHQAAVDLGERPARYETLAAHFGVTRAGLVVHCHDIDDMVVHANGFNQQCVGIEFSGMYAGVEGVLSTFWKPHPDAKPQKFTREAAESGKQLVRWICSEVARNGGQVRSLVSHRQASSQRRSDPGSEIWQQVALPMMEELGLSDGGSGFKIDDGRANPVEWDASRSERY